MRFDNLDLHSPEELVKLKELHNVLFPSTNASLDWIKWCFLRRSEHQNPRHFTRAWCVWDEDRLVGLWCVEPKDLSIDREISYKNTSGWAKVGRCFSVGIHPDYRRKNLFTELSTFAIGQERALTKYDYILGFPQAGRPVVDAHLKAGWEVTQEIATRSFSPKDQALEPLSLSNCSHLFIRDFCDVTSCPFKPVGGFREIAVSKNVRWLANPDNFYLCFRQGRAQMVLKPYAGHCHLLDLDVGDSDRDLESLLNVAKSLATRHKWSEVSAWCAENDEMRHVFERCGFQKGACSTRPVVLLSVKINARESLKFETCRFDLGVEESY